MPALRRWTTAAPAAAPKSRTNSAQPVEGETVCSVFDVSDPFKPGFIAQIPFGNLDLPSGKLRNKKSVNLVYVRPGASSPGVE